MPIFSKKKSPVTQPDMPPIPSRTLAPEQVKSALDYEVARSTRYGRPLSVLRIVPQAVDPSDVSAAELALISQAAGALLRDVDHLGSFDDQSLLAVLPETTRNAARAVAHRLKSELTIRSGATQQRSWLVGYATLDDQAATAGGLLVAALASALGRGKG